METIKTRSYRSTPLIHLDKQLRLDFNESFLKLDNYLKKEELRTRSGLVIHRRNTFGTKKRKSTPNLSRSCSLVRNGDRSEKFLTMSSESLKRQRGRPRKSTQSCSPKTGNENRMCNIDLKAFITPQKPCTELKVVVAKLSPEEIENLSCLSDESPRTCQTIKFKKSKIPGNTCNQPEVAFVDVKDAQQSPTISQISDDILTTPRQFKISSSTPKNLKSIVFQKPALTTNDISCGSLSEDSSKILDTPQERVRKVYPRTPRFLRKPKKESSLVVDLTSTDFETSSQDSSPGKKRKSRKKSISENAVAPESSIQDVPIKTRKPRNSDKWKTFRESNESPRTRSFLSTSDKTQDASMEFSELLNGKDSGLGKSRESSDNVKSGSEEEKSIELKDSFVDATETVKIIKTPEKSPVHSDGLKSVKIERKPNKLPTDIPGNLYKATLLIALLKFFHF